jgi:hypothetical protein
MANTNAPTGLRPVRYASGAPYSGSANLYCVPASDGTALFKGDPVIIAGSADADGVPTITKATAAGGNRWTGVVVGFRPSPTIIANGHRLASTLEYALVADDPNLIYEVQEDAVGGALAAVDVGLNADFIFGTGDSYTHFSAAQLDTSTKATTATLQMRIVGFVPRADNAISANAKVLVRNNLPTETGAAGSTGV